MFDKMKIIAWGDTALPVSYSYPRYEDMIELLNYQSISLETVELVIFIRE